MKLFMYSIFDAKSKLYSRPFYVINEQVAQRTAIDLVSDPGQPFSQHPEDFTMFEIGTFNDEDCKFDLLPSPRCVVRLHEIQRSLPLDPSLGE